MAEKQKLFQADNDLPVHLKGGGVDNILYRLTMTLTLGGECGTYWLAMVVAIARVWVGWCFRRGGS